MSLSRQTLHDLAAAGAAARVKEMEQQLAELFKEWPELFLSPTPPQLLAPTRKPEAPNGHGHWPAVLTSDARLPKGQLQAMVHAFFATRPAGASLDDLQTAYPALRRTQLHSVTHELVKAGTLRRVSPGHFVSRRAPRSSTWTPAMRAAAATRMRARHKDPAFRKAVAAGQQKARRAR